MGLLSCQQRARDSSRRSIDRATHFCTNHRHPNAGSIHRHPDNCSKYRRAVHTTIAEPNQPRHSILCNVYYSSPNPKSNLSVGPIFVYLFHCTATTKQSTYELITYDNATIYLTDFMAIEFGSTKFVANSGSNKFH